MILKKVILDNQRRRRRQKKRKSSLALYRRNTEQVRTTRTAANDEERTVRIMISQNIDELQKIPCWVNYIRIWNPTKGGRGGYDKPPINPYTLKDGRTNNPEEWTTYDKAAANIGKTATHRDTKHLDAQGQAPIITAPIEGPGLVLAGGYCGIDLDHVIDESGTLAEWAQNIVDRLDTYTEISPSGNGLHLIIYSAELSEEAYKRETAAFREYRKNGMSADEAIRKAKNVWSIGKQFALSRSGAITSDDRKDCELEIYFYKWGGRYFTVTGNAYIDKPINRGKYADFVAILKEYEGKAAAYKAEQAKKRAATFAPSPVGTHTTSKPATGEENKRMVLSALASINPGELEFKEWYPVVGAIKYSGFLTFADFERWTAGDMCGKTNPRNIPGHNAGIWNRAKLRDTSNTAPLIISIAKRNGWNPSEVFTEEERTKYAKSLHTEDERQKWARSKYSEEERREYGRKLHENDWTEEDTAALDDWKKRINGKSDPTDGKRGF